MSLNNKMLVAYYSRSGKTKIVAKKIAEKLGADCEEIIDKTNYKGIFGFIKGGYTAAKHKSTNIEPLKHNPEQYDLVVLCSPMWAGNIAPALVALCDKYTLPKVAWVITCANSSNNISQFPTPKDSMVAYAKFAQKQINNNEIDKDLDEFVKDIKS